MYATMVAQMYNRHIALVHQKLEVFRHMLVGIAPCNSLFSRLLMYRIMTLFRKTTFVDALFLQAAQNGRWGKRALTRAFPYILHHPWFAVQQSCTLDPVSDPSQ